MSFDVANVGCIDGSVGQRFHDRIGLTINTGSSISGLFRPIVVDGRTFDYRMNRVALGDGVRDSLQHDDSTAAAKNRAVGAGIKGPHLSVG